MKKKGTISFILIVSTLFLILSLAITGIAILMLKSSVYNAEREQARFTASSVVAQALYNLEMQQYRYATQSIRTAQGMKIEQLKIVKSILENGGEDNSFGGYKIELKSKGKDRCINNLNGAQPTPIQSSQYGITEPFSLMLIINMYKSKIHQKAIAEIGQKWGYAITTFQGPIYINNNANVTGNVACFSRNGCKSDDNTEKYITLKRNKDSNEDGDSEKPILSGDLCVRKKNSKMNSTQVDISKIDYDEKTAIWEDGEYREVKKAIRNSALDRFLNLRCGTQDFRYQLTETNELKDIVKEEEGDIVSYIKNSAIWDDEKIKKIFRTLSYTNADSDTRKLLILQKELKLNGGYDEKDGICGHSDYLIDGTVIAHAGGNDGAIPNISLNNCSLRITGDLILTGYNCKNIQHAPNTILPERIPNQNNDADEVYEAVPDKNPPKLLGDNAAIIVEGNIYITGVKMDSTSNNFVIYAGRNILLRPYIGKPDTIGADSGSSEDTENIINGAIVAKGNIYIRMIPRGRQDANKNPIIFNGAILCSGIPLTYNMKPTDTIEKKLKKLKEIITDLNIKDSKENNHVGNDGCNSNNEDRKHTIDQGGIKEEADNLIGLQIHDVDVRYDPMTTGFLNVLAGQVRLNRWIKY